MLFFCALFYCVLPFWPAHSAVIIKIKGQKALIDLDGVQAEKGDTFSALNLYGKALGLLQIKKVRRGKAIAVLLKGKMGANWILEPVALQNSRFLASVDDSHEDDYHPADRSDIYSTSRSLIQRKPSHSFGFGLITGLHANYISLSADKSIRGYSPHGALMADFSFMEGSIVSFGLRMFLGYRQLRAQGKNCGRRPCSLILHYPGGGFLLRAIFLKDRTYQPWLGAGGFLFWPFADKKHHLGLDKKSFESLHGALTGAVGIDFHFKNFYIPVQVDFNWINPILLSFQSSNPNSIEFKPFYLGAKLGLVFPF